MPIIRSLSLRVFPGRTRSTYAITWRTQRGTTTTDRRLAWGDVDIRAEGLEEMPLVQVIERVLADLRRRQGSPVPPEGLREPLGAVGGGPEDGQRLPGIDPDE